MRLPIPILALTLAGVCAGTATAQGGVVKSEAAAPDKTSRAQAEKLLKIAADLRASGQADVARVVAAQARRLLRGAAGQPGTGPRDRPDTVSQPAPRARVAVPRAPRVAVPRAPRVAVGAPLPPGAPAAVRAPKAPPVRIKADVVQPDPPVAVRPIAPPVAPPAPRAARVRRPAIDHEGPENHRGQETYRRVPQHQIPGSVGVNDTGRNRVKYVPTRTRRDAAGRLEWDGLPERGAVVPTGTVRRATLEHRVDELQDEVRKLTEMLKGLNDRLDNERLDRRRRLR